MNECCEIGHSSAPTIAVITICYNDLNGLRKTVDSIRRQCRMPEEHIVIDGGSGDGTPYFLNEYTADYAIRTVSEPDGGIYDAMNKGASLAESDVLVFMNSGDTFTNSDTLAYVSSEIGRCDEWEWGYGCMRYRDETGKLTGQAVQLPFNQRKLELGLAFIPHQSFYIRRDLFRRLGGYSLSLGTAADQDLAIRAGRVSEPAAWTAFLSDFQTGGAHSEITRLARERIYHQIRSQTGTLVGGCKPSDLAFTYAMAIYRRTRDIAAVLRDTIRARLSR